jgi:hypothetical protein
MNNVNRTSLSYTQAAERLREVDRRRPTDNGELKEYPRADWQADVAAGATSLGYWDWAEERINADQIPNEWTAEESLQRQVFALERLEEHLTPKAIGLFDVDGRMEIQRIDEEAAEYMTDDDALRQVIEMAVRGDRLAALALYMDGRNRRDERFFWPAQMLEPETKAPVTGVQFAHETALNFRVTASVIVGLAFDADDRMPDPQVLQQMLLENFLTHPGLAESLNYEFVY